MIDKEVQMHEETTFDDILTKNNIRSRRGIAATFYALLTKAKAEEIVPTQVFTIEFNKIYRVLGHTLRTNPNQSCAAPEFLLGS